VGGVVDGACSCCGFVGVRAAPARTTHAASSRCVRADWDYLRSVWKDVFADEIGPTVPEHAGMYCCAQFAVRREDILRRPRAFYQRLWDLVYNAEARLQVDVPRVLEHSWHFIMGAPVSMPEVRICDIIACDEGDPTGTGSSKSVASFFQRLPRDALKRRRRNGTAADAG
jgi:hypothetical protein